MTMPIVGLLVADGYKIFYDQKFRNVLETHMDALRTDQETINTAINSHDAYKYEYDFYGLLQKMGYPSNFHWVIMRTNDMVDPRDFRAERESMLIPSTTVIEKIRRLFMTKYTEL